MTSQHADLLNVLHEMQESLVYAVRRPVLKAAEELIASQEILINNQMTEARAIKILSSFVMFLADNRLISNGKYVSWGPQDDRVVLDDDFTADQLEALAWWMRNK